MIIFPQYAGIGAVTHCTWFLSIFRYMDWHQDYQDLRRIYFFHRFFIIILIIALSFKCLRCCKGILIPVKPAVKSELWVLFFLCVYETVNWLIFGIYVLRRDLWLKTNLSNKKKPDNSITRWLMLPLYVIYLRHWVVSPAS